VSARRLFAAVTREWSVTVTRGVITRAGGAQVASVGHGASLNLFLYAHERSDLTEAVKTTERLARDLGIDVISGLSRWAPDNDPPRWSPV
jgi:hypothetical protein